MMKTVKLPQYESERRGTLECFIDAYEPEGIRESYKFRRHLCQLLNNSRNEPDIEWVPDNQNPKVTATTQSIEGSLIQNGFTLTAWRHQKFVEETFGEACTAKNYRRGTVLGLLEYELAENALHVVAIENEDKGNGAFLRAVEAFEQVARETGATLRVVQFWNLGLAFWFERRAGWTRACSRELGEFATFTPAK